VSPRSRGSSPGGAPEGAKASYGAAEARDGAGEDGPERANYHVAALTRGLVILRVLSEAGSPLGLASLRERTTMPKSTLVRLLSVLTEAEYVVRVDETPSFWLGPSVMPLAESYASSLDISASAEEALGRLAAASGQTANVAILDGTDVVHLCVVEPDRPIRFRASTGSREAAYRTGLGKVLLAFTDTGQLDEHLLPEPYPAMTNRTITKRRDLVTELEHIRRAGFAFDNEEGDVGVCCLAVPIRRGSEVVAAISVTGPTGEFTTPARERLLAPMRQAALSLERTDQFYYALQIVRRSLR
jgi:IclR family acetate operon transcriptional repressor